MHARSLFLAAGATALAAACSASQNDGGGGPSGGSGGSGASSTGGTGAISATGGSGGTGAISAGGSSTGGSGGVDPDAGCTGVTIPAENIRQPSDIIIAIDQSGSMNLETAWVRQQINGFSQQIVQSGIDIRVVLIAGISGDNPICVDPPLGSGGCPTQDNNPPTFMHVDQQVESHDALERILDAYPQYGSVLRAGASKHIVVITDDESDMSAVDFDSGLKARDAALFAKYFFHGIVATANPATSCVTGNACCFLSGTAAGEGVIYKSLISQTGGVLGDLCLQDFQAVWTQLSRAVIESTSLACEWVIPDPPPGETLNPGKVNVRYTGGGQQKDLGRVEDAAACAGFRDAWYYDDNANPTKVLACPDVCAEIQAGQAQKVDIQFGCQNRAPIPG